MHDFIKVKVACGHVFSMFLDYNGTFNHLLFLFGLVYITENLTFLYTFTVFSP